MSTYEDRGLQERMLLKFEVEEFLFREASLLDERRLDEWLALCTDDIHYWMPIRRTTTAREVVSRFLRRTAAAGGRTAGRRAYSAESWTDRVKVQVRVM